MWPSLEMLHGVFHISLSFQPVDSQFDLTEDYLQALMMIVAVVLGIGFSILVLLALWLCLIISYVEPLTWPPWTLRFAVMAVALAQAAIASKALEAHTSFHLGLDELLAGIGSLSSRLVAVGDRCVPLVSSAAAFNASASAASACLGCHVNTSSFHGKPVCASLDDAPAAVHGAVGFEEAFVKGPLTAEHVAYVLRGSTPWHAWAAIIPYYGVALMSAGVVCGAVMGRRNLLLLVQFFAVVAWWMMCAVVSIEFAIAVGIADGCVGGAVDTVLRVLAPHGGESSDADPWLHNVTMHYLADCAAPNPAISRNCMSPNLACCITPQIRDPLPPRSRGRAKASCASLWICKFALLYPGTSLASRLGHLIVRYVPRGRGRRARSGWAWAAPSPSQRHGRDAT